MYCKMKVVRAQNIKAAYCSGVTPIQMNKTCHVLNMPHRN